MIKSCNNCGWQGSEDSVFECEHPDFGEFKFNCSMAKSWKPKEEKSMEKIVMTEEQYIDIMKDSCVFDLSKKGIENSLKKAKEKGYIKKTDLEIAKDEWEIYVDQIKQYGWVSINVYFPASNYITELQKEINKLRGESCD